MKSLAVCGALLFGLGHAAAWACPPVPDAARLQALADKEKLDAYAVLRVLKCGWQQSLPVTQAWYDSQQARQEPGEQSADHLLAVVALTRLNPTQIAPLLAGEFGDELDEETPPETQALARLKISSATLASRFERSLDPAVAWLRERAPLPALVDLQLELSLAAQEIRQDRLDAARMRLADARRHLEQLSDGEQETTEALEEVTSFEQLLAPARAQSLATDAGWVLDRGGRRYLCGTGRYMQRWFGHTYLREEILSRIDPALALGDLLAGDWRAQIDGLEKHTDFLARLLKQRYSRDELRQGWEDALASLRNDEAVTGLSVFGHFLPLPVAVMESSAEASDPAGMKRRFSDAELTELVRNTPLYKATYPD